MSNLSELSIAELEAEIARRKQEVASKFEIPKRLSSILATEPGDITKWKARAYEDIETDLENNLRVLIDSRADEETIKNELFMSVIHTVYGEAGLQFIDKLSKRHKYGPEY